MNQDDPHEDGFDPYSHGQEIDPPTTDPHEELMPEPSGRLANEPVVPTAVFCLHCGYNLTGVAIGSTCPECGTRVMPLFQGHLLPTSGKAVAAMVLGICSIVGCMFYGIPSLICGPLAIIFAIQAKKQISQGEAGSSSLGMATAGLVCGIIGLSMVILIVGIAVVFIVLQRI